MKWGQRRIALAAVALCASAVLPVVVAVPSGAAESARVTLPGAVPAIPSGAARFGATPGDQVLHLDVMLAGRDPAGLSQFVEAVSTAGSPEYRHYLTADQYEAAFGPAGDEVARVSAVLRSEGLTVGTPDPGSSLLPVSGTAAAVSSALDTGLQTVALPGQARAVINTASPSVAASLAGAVTGVIGLDGLFREHSMIRHAPAPAAGSGSAGAATATGPATSAGGGEQSHALVAHSAPQACPATAGAGPGVYTSTQMASIYGLDQLLNQGRTGLHQTIAVVEFEQYLQSDFASFQACYGLANSIRNVNVDGGPGGPDYGPSGEAALDTELAAVSAPSASLVVYGAPNGNDADAIDLLNRIAGDDVAQVVTTSWGDCEQDILSSDPQFLQTENGIFQRMAAQGQTVIAASGDTGSEDCYPSSGSLAVDDPGAQPDVISAGGTTLNSASAASQVVWNCGIFSLGCASGATGGGYSQVWPSNPGQPAVSGGDTHPCPQAGGCRAVPDIVIAADPSHGAVAGYWQGEWTGFGGTSVGAPTNAGLFADTNQGCFTTLGRVGPALYAAAAASSSNFTDITSGNNDYTMGHGGDFAAGPGFDAASGLGSPVDQNLAIALQGADGCPSVASVSPNSGPTVGGGAITISGGGLANATAVNFGSVGAGQIVSQTETSLTVIPPNALGPICVDITVANSQGISATSPADRYLYGGDGNCGQGYRFVASDGGVFDFGDAGFWGSTGNIHLNSPMVGMAATASTNGYWLVAADGGVFTFGDARFFGSTGNLRLNKPVVGMAALPNGDGYWLVASDGGVFTFGNAQFHGSTGNLLLNKPIVGMASTPDGHGYWLVASDGGIFSFGDAAFWGSTGALHLNSPIVGMAAGAGGGGYWLVAADGGVFSFGDTTFWGSMGATRLNKPIVGMAATPDAAGYWLVAADGGIFTFGDSQFYGSTGNILLNQPIVGMSSA